MNAETKRLILDKIKEYDTVIITRHKRPDGDAVGSTMGLYKILRLTYPEKNIFLDNDDYSDYVAFLGDEGEHPTDDDYDGALVMILDTGTEDRISNGRYTLGDLIIKIDHHIDDKPYGDISWVEDDRSSVCEMITDFYLTFKDELKIDKDAAACLYTGMVTDSGRFRFRDTDGDTLRCAAALLDVGIDTEKLFAYLYMDDISVVKFKAEIMRKICISKNGVAYIHIGTQTIKQYGLSMEDASAMVSVMDSIKGSLIWLAFIENGDGSTRVRLRSRFVEVQELATHYNGGGHACAAGATVYSQGEEMSLIAEADAILKKYKEENTGWI